MHANFSSQTLTGNLNLSVERFTVNSARPSVNPSVSVVTTFVTVAGVSFAGSGSLPNGTVDGQVKTIVVSAMGSNCTYTLSFGPGRLVMPNPLDAAAVPTKAMFKRRGQSMTLVWDHASQFWVPTGGNGVYVS